MTTDTMKTVREALIQARGALFIDCMVDEDGKPYGTTTVAVRAIDEALTALEAPAGEDEPPCSVCGSEERGQGGYLSCECPAPAGKAVPVAVKPLEWHTSHIGAWNGDYHTVPTGYTVRCADENGWKWSGIGGHGYASSPGGAMAAAQADHERRIRSALVAAPPAEPSAEVASAAAELFCRNYLIERSEAMGHEQEDSELDQSARDLFEGFCKYAGYRSPRAALTKGGA